MKDDLLHEARVKDDDLLVEAAERWRDKWHTRLRGVQ